MSVDKEHLRTLAMTATPGPWTVDPYQYDKDGEQKYFPTLRFKGKPTDYRGRITINEPSATMATLNATAEFIATANPLAVIELLDEIAEQRQRILMLEIRINFGWTDEVGWLRRDSDLDRPDAVGCPNTPIGAVKEPT